MYVRKISRRNKDGSTVTYVQLAHNVWDKEKGHARAEVIYSFLSPEDALKAQATLEKET